MIRKTIYFFLLLAVVFFTCYIWQDKKTSNQHNTFARYTLVMNWPQLPIGFILGNPTGIGIDSNQNIFVFHRAGREWPWFGSMPDEYIHDKTILLLDNKTGKILNSWGDNLFIMPHGLTVDEQDNVWVSDVGLQQVFKFSHEGQLLLKIGQANSPGNDTAHFNRPTDIAVDKNGSFYVSDGYLNSRIIKFSSTGKYLFEWGKKGNAQGEFNIPHGITLDENGNVFVADRENNRVQVFDSSGKFLRQYASDNFGNICSVNINKVSGQLFAVDDLSFLKIKHRGSDVIIFDSCGKTIIRFGRSGSYTGNNSWYHDLVTDNSQDIYVTDILENKIQKFKRTIER